MDDLLTDLKILIDSWDQEAKGRHIDGMGASADTLRGCRDELRALVKRHETKNPSGTFVVESRDGRLEGVTRLESDESHPERQG